MRHMSISTGIDSVDSTPSDVKVDVLGDDKLSAHEYPKYDMMKDYPAIYQQAEEHIKRCMAHAQSSARHHLGIGNPLDEENLKQGVFYINQIAGKASEMFEISNKLLIGMTVQMSELTSLISTLKETNVQIVDHYAVQRDEMYEAIKKELQRSVNRLNRYVKIAGLASIPLVAIASFVFTLIL